MATTRAAIASATALTLSVGLFGCSGPAAKSAAIRHSGPSTTVQRSSASPPSTSKTADPSAPFDFQQSETEPAVRNRGTDYLAITRSLLEFQTWLESHNPDSTLISRIAAPGSAFESALGHDIGVLARLNRRYYETQSGPDKYTIADVTSDVVTIHDQQPLTIQRTVDSNGRVASERRFTTPYTSYTIVLTRMVDGRWLLADIEAVT